MLKPGRVMGRRVSAPRRQRGVVLLLALIILVAMTLAGIGMMRSVDTGNVIAGNLAFRQATAHANDAGINAAFTVFATLANSPNIANRPILNFNNGMPCPAGVTTNCTAGAIDFPGYFSAPLAPCEVDLTCVGAEYAWWTVAGNWAGAPSVTVFTDPADPASPAIATVSYLIHRMCNTANAAPAQSTCQWEPEPGCKAKPGIPCLNSVLYRITVRAVGARNTVTYSQGLVLNPENNLPVLP